MEIPEELRYTQEHEWVRVEKDGDVVVGITDYAQEQLGDIVFVELPSVDEDENSTVSRDEPFAVVESVKAASDIYAPISGRVVEVNDELPATPDIVNEDCYGDGWMVRMKPSNPSELEELLTADAYQEFIQDLDG